MRKTFAILGLLALALLVVGAAVAGISSVRSGEGTLSVEDGHGKIVVQARGGVIGRLERGFVVIHDLTPEDAYDAYVYGDDLPPRFVGESGIRYGGQGLRFRLVGGRYRIVIDGRGIDLSVVGKGSGTIVALPAVDPGVYSLDGADCRNDRESCKPLPALLRRFQLDDQERGEKSGDREQSLTRASAE
jgi:hypothetical protein